MTLTSLIHAAACASTQSASALAQMGKTPAPESAVPLFGDVAEFAARLEALFTQAASSTARNANVAAAAPSTSRSVTEEATASAAATSDSAVQLAATANLPEKAAATSKPESTARNAHTAHADRIHSQDDSTVAQPSRRPLTLQVHIAASSVEYTPTFPAAVPEIATAAPQPAPLPISFTAALPLSSPEYAPAAGSAASVAAHAAYPSDKSNDPSPSPLPANATASMEVEKRANIDAVRGVATGTPTALLPEVSETSQAPGSAAVVFQAAASQVSGPAPRSHDFRADIPGESAPLREELLSDGAVQSAPVPLANVQTVRLASPNLYTAAASAQTAAAHVAPFAKGAAPQHQAPPSDTASSSRAPLAASQASTLAAAIPSADQAATAQPASLQAATAQCVAPTNSKSQPAPFRSSPHLGDPSSITTMFPAAASDPHVAETRSAQPTAQAVTGTFSPQSTFAALDAATPSPSTLFTHAGARHAEAGYLDPSLGWVGVRAEVSGGALHAAIVPASSQAADILGAHLPALHAYVSQQHGLESTIDMSWQNDPHTGGGSQQSTHQDPHASAGDDPNGSKFGSPSPSVAQPSSFASFDAAGAPPPASGGRYISVLA